MSSLEPEETEESLSSGGTACRVTFPTAQPHGLRLVTVVPEGLLKYPSIKSHGAALMLVDGISKFDLLEICTPKCPGSGEALEIVVIARSKLANASMILRV